MTVVIIHLLFRDLAEKINSLICGAGKSRKSGGVFTEQQSPHREGTGVDRQVNKTLAFTVLLLVSYLRKKICVSFIKG